MNRYLTSLFLPDEETFRDWVKGEVLVGGHKEWSFALFNFYEDSEQYPLGVFPNGLDIEFEPVTILYGNNGCGKSTILNLLAEMLEIGRRVTINNSPFFSLFAKFCKLTTHSDFDDINRRRDIITSDDVFKQCNLNAFILIFFKHCFSIRDSNRETMKSQNQTIQDKVNIMHNEGRIKPLRGLADFERWKRDVSLKHESFSKNLKKYNQHLLRPESNGETALRYFTSSINSAGLYLLDEPENSLSPLFQLKLLEFLEQTSQWMGMQFIIATHSPLLLGMRNAKIINLDEEGAPERKWAELENIRILHDFFKGREEEFE